MPGGGDGLGMGEGFGVDVAVGVGVGVYLLLPSPLRSPHGVGWSVGTCGRAGGGRPVPGGRHGRHTGPVDGTVGAVAAAHTGAALRSFAGNLYFYCTFINYYPKRWED